MAIEEMPAPLITSPAYRAAMGRIQQSLTDHGEALVMQGVAIEGLQKALAEMQVEVRSQIVLTPSQARAVKQAVEAKVRATGLQGQARRERYARLWRAVRDRFDVASYREIPRHLFAKVMGLLDAYDPANDAFGR